MAEIIAAPVAEIVVENLFARIGLHLGYLWNYHGNISDVTKQVEKLRDGRLRVQQSVDEANRQGDEIFPDVQKWLSRAEEMILETDKFIADERKANRGCFHLKLRYQHSKKAKNQSVDIVDKIQEAVKYGRVAHRPPPPGIASSAVRGSQVFKSRETTLNQIMEALRDDGIRMIGVWGMGGVGKTTLVQQVAERAQAAKQASGEKLFDTVVMALNITQTPNLTKIQGDIASIIGLKLEERDESARAIRLSQSLKKHKKILVILDDIWEPITFERIGIPYGSSDDHPMGYCKVLLTSREHDLLLKDMGTHKDFHVQHLSEEEAWSLFKQTTGDSVEKSELQPIAIEVVKECEGLPVAIVTIAKALKGETMGVWRNALEELRRSMPINIRGLSKNVYACLELSYNHLESDEAKSLFLLCGLLGDEDISMEDLIKYVMGLDLFDYMDSLEKARDKIVTLVKILKASSLLLDVPEFQHRPKIPSLYFVEEEGSNQFVRIHDVILDVAKSIASKDPRRFVVKEDMSLQEMEKRGDELGNCTGLSLKCRRVQELPGGLVCPKLGFFLLDSSDDSLKIPDSFFEEMKEVKVISMSQFDLTQLPSSLHFLSNVRTLCLYGCGTLKDMTMLGELKKLQILSILDCEIVELPKEMMQLNDLRMLILSNRSQFIPRNVIASLSRLEHLCLRGIFYIKPIRKEEEEDEEEEEEKEHLSLMDFYLYSLRNEGEQEAAATASTCISELKRLSNLRALEVEIPGSFSLPKDLSFDNLNRYDIVMGCERDWSDSMSMTTTSRRLKLKNIKGPRLVKSFSKLLKITEVLELIALEDTRHFVNELDCDGFLHLQVLSISSTRSMQYIMNSSSMEMEMEIMPNAFPLLKDLSLVNLNNLEAVCHGPMPVGCFANLRLLKIAFCCSLKCILLWLPTTTTQLDRESVDLVVFPQLRRLELIDLPDLIDFYSTRTSGNQEPLFIPFFNHQVAFPKLEILKLKSIGKARTMWHNQHPVGSCCKLKKLALQKCENLQTVFPSNFLKGSQSLQILEIDDCSSLKEIFEINSISAVSPGKRFSLHSQNMESVVRSTTELDPQGQEIKNYLAFQNLNSLQVGNCHSLKYIFPTSVVKGLMLLEVLKISDCRALEGIVAANENEEQMPTFVFPRLTSLKLSKLGQLKRLYQGMYTLECPLLKYLDVCNCDNVELLFQEKGVRDDEVDKQPLFLINKKTFPNVKDLALSKLKGTVEIWRGQFSRESFGELRNLRISDCHNISIAMPSNVLQQLHNLQILHLRRCNSVREVIQMEGEVGNTGDSTFPQLTELEVSECGSLRYIVSPSMAKSLVHLKNLSITDCSMVKEIVGDDDDTELDQKKLQLDQHLVNLKSFSSSVSYSTLAVALAFPSLEEMEIKELAKLTHIYKKIPPGILVQNLQNLRVLEVSHCGNLEVLLTLSMVKTLGLLEKLTVEDYDELKEIVESEGDYQSDEIIFTQLQELGLYRLPHLKRFCSATNTSFRFPCLTDMWVWDCPEMEYFCKGDSITPRLESVKMDYFLSYWDTDLNATIHQIFKFFSELTSTMEDGSEEKEEPAEESDEDMGLISLFD